MSAAAEARQLELFRMDVARWIRPQDVADTAEVTWPLALGLLYRHPPLRAMAWFRLGSWAKHRGVPGFGAYVQRRLLRLYGLEISPGAPVGGGLYIAHPVACVLVSEEMGSNVTVIANVILGTRTDARWPRIGNGVFLGAGARVLGGIDVGAGASVGANAVVVHDVAAGATVTGIPARPLLPRSERVELSD